MKKIPKPFQDDSSTASQRWGPASISLWFLRMTLTSLWIFWLGGLTFYMAIVVPVGGEVLGGGEQGRVTARVTEYLNGFGIAAALSMAFEGRLRKDAMQVGLALGMLLPQAVLYLLHFELSARLRGEPSNWLEEMEFYSVHRIYLWTTTLQWLMGVILQIRTGARGRFPENLT